MEVDLLCNYPRTKRNIQARQVTQSRESVVAMNFGREYFDGTRAQGYGGYKDDGRWIPVAKTFVEHWNLKSGDRVLDIGCAKGFLVKALMDVCPGLEAFGLDVSEYAISCADASIKDRLKLGNAMSLPYPDGFFKAAISINTAHNLVHDDCVLAFKEMQRVAPNGGYVQVDSWRNEQEHQNLLNWVLTAKTYYDPAGWESLFKEAGYTGDYYWTITE